MYVANQKDEDLVQAWCNVNDPKANSLLNLNLSEAASKFMAAAGNNPAVNNSSVLGESYAKNENKMSAAIKSGSREELIEIFRKYPLCGCTSVIDMARVASGYDPNGSTEDAKNTAKFNDYLKRVLSAPFFHLSMNEYSEYHRKEKEWSTVINDIANLFDGLSAEDKIKVKTSIQNLANAASSSKETTSTDNLYSVSTLYNGTSPDTINVYLYNSTISMEERSKGSSTKKTDIYIRRISLKFNIEMWSYYAPTVAEKHIKLVDDWLNDNTTQQGDLNVKLCIGGYQELK